MVLGKLDIHMQKNVVGPLPYTTYLIPHTKMNSKCLKNLNAKTWNYKIPRKKKNGESPNIGFGNNLLDMTPKAHVTTTTTTTKK